MNATTHKTTKVDAGNYIYRGRDIYRITDRRDAYNPWKISLVKRSFATLAEAKAWIDQQEEASK